MVSCPSELLPKVDFLFAEDGTIAVKIVKKMMLIEARLDCIFLDFTMIKMHGPEAASKIRDLGYRGPILGEIKIHARVNAKLKDRVMIKLLFFPCSKNMLFECLGLSTRWNG